MDLSLGQVVEVYKQCGFDATLKPNTLFMLSELEAKLEDLLSALDQMPEDYVIKVRALHVLTAGKCYAEKLGLASPP